MGAILRRVHAYDVICLMLTVPVGFDLVEFVFTSICDSCFVLGGEGEMSGTFG